ncbi:GNAT family N-acetyltransferase [Neomicrococcus aestuarii]|uniref:N-acetyltransferase domain-containing protein n=1 Tax=Neomicrococcus aestuarii TaxID=556325 RepID=A0A1L2ZLZ5_9MICC|nr:GNAT family N-acetyltransferase [Neomicrococcus aestuarii]APF40032.1 hypothetical protein BHE16_02240 [Neomicrococcus aestuarii]
MTTIRDAQSSLTAWYGDLAAATGGRTYTSSGCQWVWLPARNRLHLMFPDKPVVSSIKPGLAEGVRLGARDIYAWVNASVRPGVLEDFGFRAGPPLMWTHGLLRPTPTGKLSEFNVSISSTVPGARGADVDELDVANGAWPVRHVLAVDSSGQPVGRGFARGGPSGLVTLHNLAVASDVRRRGVGTAMVRRLLSEFPPADESAEGASEGQESTNGSDGLQVVAAGSPLAQPFLRSLGLQPLGVGRQLRLTLKDATPKS